MGDSVLANKRSVLHKGSSGKSIAAFPDVCLCPPPAPTGPVPTPLPNNAMASDLADGATSVLIEGNPTGTKKSKLSKSTGNEVSKPTGGGVASHATQGAAHFCSFSFDVKAEGEGVVRHMDITTHNHSTPGNTAPWPVLASMAVAVVNACSQIPEDPCRLRPYKEGCPKPRTPHHVLPSSFFVQEGLRPVNVRQVGGVWGAKKSHIIPPAAMLPQGATITKGVTILQQHVEATCVPGCESYRAKDAPCICVTGKGKDDQDSETGKLLQHGRIHRRLDLAEGKAARSGGWVYAEARDAAAMAVEQVLHACSAGCIKAQLDEYHLRQCKIDEKTPLRANDYSDKEVAKFEADVASENNITAPLD